MMFYWIVFSQAIELNCFFAEADQAAAEVLPLFATECISSSFLKLVVNRLNATSASVKVQKSECYAGDSFVLETSDLQHFCF